MALRARVVAFVEEGNGHREAARHFRVSPKFVNDMMRLKRESGGLAPKRQGSRGRGKLAGVADWVRRRLAGKGDITAIAWSITPRSAAGAPRPSSPACATTASTPRGSSTAPSTGRPSTATSRPSSRHAPPR